LAKNVVVLNKFHQDIIAHQKLTSFEKSPGTKG